MSNQSIRWIQRLDSYSKAFIQLELAVVESTKKEFSNLEKEGVIQRFEYTQELSWKVIKDFYEYLGDTTIQGSRDAFRLALNRGLFDLDTATIFMNSIKSRNKTAHTYNEEIANKIFNEIINDFYYVFKTLKEILEDEKLKRGL